MKITMLGHATLLIEINKKRILTDPWLTPGSYFGIVRQQQTPADIQDILPIDIILASHGHEDHLDPKTMVKIPKNTPVVINKESTGVVAKMGFKSIHSMDENESIEIEGIKIMALPGQHSGGIATYMVYGTNERLFFAGDSNFCPELERAIKGERPDVCLLPISGGGIGLFAFHMTPLQATQIAIVSGAKNVIPIHFHFKTPWQGLTRLLSRPNCLSDFERAMNEYSPRTNTVCLDYNDTWNSKALPSRSSKK